MPDRKRGLILEKEKGKSPCSQGIIKNKNSYCSPDNRESERRGACEVSWNREEGAEASWTINHN